MFRLRLLILLEIIVCFTCAKWNDSMWDHEQNRNYWYDHGKSCVNERLAYRQDNKPAKNAILLIGDGMGISTTAAGRIFTGQRKGLLGESYQTEMDKFPYVGLVKTYNIDRQTPDSAATATAYLCGVKARSGTIGVDGKCVRKDLNCCGKNEVKSILYAAKQSGKSTGVVTSTRLTHASPASSFAHSPDRDWEVYDDVDFGNDQSSRGCEDIAAQLIKSVDYIDLFIGGGRRSFLPSSMSDPEYPDLRGMRTDGRNLIEEWQSTMFEKKQKKAHYIWSNEQFRNIDTSSVEFLLALLEPSHMPYELDRLNQKLTEPTLAEMVDTAIQILSKNPNGYVLFVESGRIDHAHHASKAQKSLMEYLAMDNVLKVVNMHINNASIMDTQVVVSADHSHVFTVGGYAQRNNDILGFAANYNENGSDVDSMPMTAILYANGPGYIPTEVRLNKSYWMDVPLQSPEFRQHSAVPLDSESHSAEDVAVYAKGPRSHLYTGTIEQSDIFHLMVYSMCLNEYKNDPRCWNRKNDF